MTREQKHNKEILDLMNNPAELNKRISKQIQESKHWKQITAEVYPTIKAGDRVRYNFGGLVEERILDYMAIRQMKIPGPGHGVVIFLSEMKVYRE